MIRIMKNNNIKHANKLIFKREDKLWFHNQLSKHT